MHYDADKNEPEITPTTRLREEMNRLNLSYEKAAALIAINRKTMFSIVNGKRRASAAIALKIENRFGILAEELMLEWEITKVRRQIEEAEGLDDVRR